MKQINPTRHGDWIIDEAGTLIDRAAVAAVDNAKAPGTVASASKAADAATQTAAASGNRNRTKKG
jgi:hypothetical protein